MKCGDGRDMHLAGNFFAAPAKFERDEKMNDICAFKRVLQDGVVRFGKTHPLPFGHAGDDGNISFSYGILIFFGRTDRYDAHLMPPLTQRRRITLGGDGGAVVAIVKLVDDQNDAHV